MAHSTTSNEMTQVGADDDAAAVRNAYDRLRAGYEANVYPDYEERRHLLDKLLEVVLRRREEVAAASVKDWGHRSRVDTLLGDVLPTVSAIKYARSELRGWMKPSRRTTSLNFRPGHNRVLYQPLGVVGVIAPWNYPFQLCVEPLVFAIAAGNRVLVKPSELTPHSGALVKEMLADVFDESWVSVVQGGAATAAAVTSLPLDHLMFTGSTRVGRMVMKAAAENLVPVTLELGGKSPALIHPDYPIDKAASRLVFGKLYNGGQTCIGVDYLLVHKDKMEAMVSALQQEIAARYPTIANNPDYNAIATAGHYKRITSLVESAVQAGAKAIEIKPEGEVIDPASRRIAPTLLTGVTDDMTVMQEEIFGPVLPIVPYESVEEAVRYINARPRPLAFYYFDKDSARADQVLRSTLSGTACVNDCVLQYVQDAVPFGGVGASGMGAYHGREGFETFSHKRGVFYQSQVNFMGIQAPPHGARMERLLRYLFGG